MSCEEERLPETVRHPGGEGASDEKAGGVADPRQTFIMRGRRRILQRIGAAGVEENEVQAVALLDALSGRRSAIWTDAFAL